MAVKKAGPVQWCMCLSKFLTGLWAFLMLTFFPLYVHNRYFEMGVYKFRFFLTVSLCCLLPAGILQVLCLIGGRNWRSPKELCGALSTLDRAMLMYLFAVCISWFGSVDRQQAWTGVEGWYAGLRTQMLLVLLYFLMSRLFSWKRVIFLGHFCGSAAVFLLGLLHRFKIDPLGMYEGIDESYQLLFLSTIGQASWYSGYVCIVLVIGVTALFLAQEKVLRAALSGYCALGFAAVVTQNSDSAFAAMAAMLFVFFLAACDSLDAMERFLEIALLMLGSFKTVGILQLIFPDLAVRLGGLSEFWSRSRQSWFLLLLVCVVYTVFLFYRQKHPEKLLFINGKRMRMLAVGVAVAGICTWVCLIWLNTTGVLERWIGWKSEQQYLLFDLKWGNSRGFIWKFTVRNFSELSFGRKVFGVGPDCFAAYCYGNSSLADELSHYFGMNQTLTNAHNEFLNALFCTGVLGMAAFGMIFAAAFCRFFGRRNRKTYALAGALAVLVYAAHNFFGYQQVCCAPFLFLILGMAENLVRRSLEPPESAL